MSTVSTATLTTALPTRLTAGVLGGLAGGVMFGILMQMMDMIPMVAMLVDSMAVAVGWLVHLAISAFIGAIYPLLFAAWATRLVPAALMYMADPDHLPGDGGEDQRISVPGSRHFGLGYGMVWWAVAPC
jgi:hypothetical protein